MVLNLTVMGADHTKLRRYFMGKLVVVKERLGGEKRFLYKDRSARV